MAPSFVVCSFGGCGSKFLVKQIARHLQIPVSGTFHSHERYPQKAGFSGSTKIIFIYGDPLAAVHSFFNRRNKNTAQHGFDERAGSGSLTWARDHCRNIGGQAEKLRVTWGIEDYVANGEELFLLEDFVSNWLSFSRSAGFLLLRYEAMWNHLPSIADYLGMDAAFIESFEPRRPRSSMQLLDATTASRLRALYSEVTNIVEALPDFSLRH